MRKQKDTIGFKVDATEYCDVVRERDPDDEWSGEDTSSSWTIEGVALAHEYPDVTACFDVEPGDVLYLVYVVYSTGDSLSHSEDGSIAYIDVYKTESKAITCAKAIREHNEHDYMLDDNRLSLKERRLLAKGFNSLSVDYIRENGDKATAHATWNGYFERLSYVEVHSFTVGAMKRRRF